MTARAGLLVSSLSPPRSVALLLPFFSSVCQKTPVLLASLCGLYLYIVIQERCGLPPDILVVCDFSLLLMQFLFASGVVR